MREVPIISAFMTATPVAISGDETIASAASRMSELEVRHLPVVEGGKLCGVISDRDIKFVESFSDVDAKELTVRAAMNELPYAVGPDAALDEVAATMAREKHGSAVIVHDGRVIGIFTTVDACRALSELFGRHKKGL